MQPSDLYPSALRFPTDERKAFHLSATIAFNWPAIGAKKTTHGFERRDIDQADDPETPVARVVPLADSTIYEDGAARRVPATLRAFATMRRMGSERSGGLARLAAIHTHRPCATSRCYAAALSPGESAGSSSKSGIDGGMRTGTYFWPAYPGVDDVRPLLHHVPALHFIFCPVVTGEEDLRKLSGYARNL